MHCQFFPIIQYQMLVPPCSSETADCTNTASSLLPLNMYGNAGRYVAKTFESKPNRKEKLRRKKQRQEEIPRLTEMKTNAQPELPSWHL